MEISGQDTAAELAALKATAKAQEAKSKAQDAKIKGLSAQLRDKKKADMAKRQSSSKDSTCHASLHGCVFDQQFVPHTPARKSTSLKEPLDPAPAFNSPVSQALQSRPRERMPCFP